MTISIKTSVHTDRIPGGKYPTRPRTRPKGQRHCPPPIHNQKNFRVDKGATISDDQIEIILQANKDAENPEVKKAAQKNRHDEYLGQMRHHPQECRRKKGNIDLEARASGLSLHRRVPCRSLEFTLQMLPYFLMCSILSLSIQHLLYS